MGLPLYKTDYFSLGAFKSFSLSLTFETLIIGCLGMGFFGSSYMELSASWIWMSVYFPMWGKFSPIISANEFSGPLSPCSSGTLIISMLVYLGLFHKSLNLSSFFFFFSFLLLWLDVFSCPLSLLNFLLHLVSCWTPLVYYSVQILFSSLWFLFGIFLHILFLCWDSHFVYVVPLSSVSICRAVLLNSLSGKWLISNSLQSFSEILSCSFIWNIFFYLFILFFFFLLSFLVSLH